MVMHTKENRVSDTEMWHQATNTLFSACQGKGYSGGMGLKFYPFSRGLAELGFIDRTGRLQVAYRCNMPYCWVDVLGLAEWIEQGYYSTPFSQTTHSSFSSQKCNSCT